MDENHYWINLEIRLCREFAGLSERRYQYFWCDGFNPIDYILDDPSPRITGRCWICNSLQQAEWSFVLLLPRRFHSRVDIDWAALLPTENETRWMLFDESRQFLEIEPAVAVPDLG